MKLFRSYSTAESNERFCDNIINTETQKLDGIKTGFDAELKAFVIKITITEGMVAEIHQTVDIARARINEILIAWGADASEAAKLALDMRFLKN